MALELRIALAEGRAGHGDRMSAGQTVEYTCPMHSEIVRSEPGSCPKCGMTLVPRGASMDHSTEHPDMMVENHRNMLWPHYLSMMLGLWLLTSPFTLGYLSDFVPDANQLRVMAERGLPSFELRNLLMTWSDVISGILVIVFSVLSADTWRRNPWAQWANAFVGLLAAVRAAGVLDAVAGGLRQWDAGRRAGDRAFSADPDDAGHEHGRHDGQAGHAAGMGLYAVELVATHADRCARPDRFSHRARPGRLSARPHR